MKLTPIALSTATVLATLTGTAMNSQAQTQVNEAIDILNSAPPGEATFNICADRGICSLPYTDPTVLTTGTSLAPNINT